jgi:hypothetical protein
MTTSREELTIDELLGDPVTRAIMKADGVDPAALEALLRSMGRTVARRPEKFVFEGDRAQSRWVAVGSRICEAP